MARLEFEVRKREGNRGSFFMGNLRFPAQVDTDDLVGFFFPDQNDPQRGFIAIEPRRDRNDRPNRSEDRENRDGKSED